MKKINWAITDRQKITDDVDRISEILFGMVHPYADWNTFLKTLALLEKNPSLDMNTILSEYRIKLGEEGLRVPVEIS